MVTAPPPTPQQTILQGTQTMHSITRGTQGLSEIVMTLQAETTWSFQYCSGGLESHFSQHKIQVDKAKDI